MSLRTLRARKSALAVAACVLALAAVLLVPAADASAQDDDGVVVGTYQPQRVAQAVGFQQQVMQQMQGLQQRAQQAQQSGDQEAMQQIQMEAQQIQQDAGAKLMADIEAVLPQVAEEAGATIIATDVAWSAADVTTEDVTQAIIDAMGAGEEAAGSGSETSEGSGE